MRRQWLIARRTMLGYSQMSLAHALGTAVSTVQRWEQGTAAITARWRPRLAEVLELSLEDLDRLLAPPVSPYADPAFATSPPAALEPPVQRREFLSGAIAAAALPALPVPVASDVVELFASQLAAYWQADRRLGPHLLIEAAVPQAHLVLRTVGSTTGALHRDLLQLAVGYTGLVGWLYQDAGDLSTCSQWLDETLELAHRAGDPQLVAYALTCKAMVRADAGDGTAAVDLGAAALSASANPCAKAKVMALQQATRGYALLGDREAVEQRLDELAGLVGDVDERLWGRDRAAFTPNEIVVRHRATCYGLLGAGIEAAELWSSVAPSSDHRDAGVYLARHATALLDAGQPRQAAIPAAEGVGYLQETGSARMRREFSRLTERAEHWRGLPAGRDLINVLEEAHGTS